MVRQIAGGGQNQKALGIKIESAHRKPFSGFDGRQFIEYRGPTTRISIANDFASRLVVEQHAGRLCRKIALEQPTIDAHLVSWQNALANMGGLAIDRNATGDNEFLHLTP